MIKLNIDYSFSIALVSFSRKMSNLDFSHIWYDTYIPYKLQPQIRLNTFALSLHQFSFHLDLSHCVAGLKYTEMWNRSVLTQAPPPARCLACMMHRFNIKMNILFGDIKYLVGKLWCFQQFLRFYWIKKKWIEFLIELILLLNRSLLSHIFLNEI